MTENTEKFENAPETPIVPPLRDTQEDRYIPSPKKSISHTPAVSAEMYPAERGLSTKKFLSRYGLFLRLAAVFALAAAVLWPLIHLLDFDTALGHIASGSLLFVALCVCLIAGVITAVICAFSAKRVRLYRYPDSASGETFFGVLAAALFAIRFMQDVYNLYFPKEVSNVSGILPLLEKMTAWTSVFCLLYFLCIGLGKRGTAVTLFAIGSALHITLLLFRDYFDFSLPLNSPLRNMTLLITVAFLLFLLAESRMQTDLWYAETPFALFAAMLFLVFGGIALGQCAVALIFETRGRYELLAQASTVAAAGLAFCRLRRYPSLVGDHVPPPPSKDDIKKEEKRLKSEGTQN